MSLCCFRCSLVHATLLFSFPPHFAVCRIWKPPYTQKWCVRGPGAAPRRYPFSQPLILPSPTLPRFPSLLRAVKTAAINRDLLRKAQKGGRWRWWRGERKERRGGVMGRRSWLTFETTNISASCALMPLTLISFYALISHNSMRLFFFFPQCNIPQFALRLSFIKAYWEKKTLCGKWN